MIPTFPTPKGFDEKSYLHTLVYQGLACRYAGVSLEASAVLSIDEAKKLISTKVLERTEYELGVIDRMGFNGYFLIVQDFINWGRVEVLFLAQGEGVLLVRLCHMRYALLNLIP